MHIILLSRHILEVIDFFFNISNFLIYFSGHGFSSAPDKPKSYTFKKLLHDTQTIFDHFIPRNRECIVIGHSYGCSMAAALTRSRQGLLLATGRTRYFGVYFWGEGGGRVL